MIFVLYEVFKIRQSSHFSIEDNTLVYLCLTTPPAFPLNVLNNGKIQNILFRLHYNLLLKKTDFMGLVQLQYYIYITSQWLDTSLITQQTYRITVTNTFPVQSPCSMVNQHKPLQSSLRCYDTELSIQSHPDQRRLRQVSPRFS